MFAKGAAAFILLGLAAVIIFLVAMNDIEKWQSNQGSADGNRTDAQAVRVLALVFAIFITHIALALFQ